MKKLLPAFLLIVLFCSCAEKTPTLTEQGIAAYLPKGAQTVIQLPSYSAAVRELFSMTALLFGRESVSEIRHKVFAVLSRQLNIQLLNPDRLQATGLSTDRPVLASGYPGGGVYLSLPITSVPGITRSLKRRFPEMVQRQSTGSSLFSTEDKDLRFRLTGNRLYVFYKIEPDSKKKGSYPAALFGKGKNRYRCWLSYSRAVQSGIPFLQSSRSPLFLSYSRSGRSLSLHTSLFHKKSDPLIPILGTKLSRLLIWKPRGQGLAEMATRRDIFFLNFRLSLETIWNSMIRPRIKAAAEKKIGTLASMASRLFGGGRSLVDQAIDRVGVEKNLLSQLNGEIALAIRTIKDLPLNRPVSAWLNAFDATLMLGTKGYTAAGGCIDFLKKNLRLVNTRLIKLKKDTFTYYSLSLSRFGIHRRIYLSRRGGVLCFSPTRQGVLGKSNRLSPRHSFSSRGPLAGLSRGREHKYWLSLSLQGLLTAIASKLDWKTQANFGPIRNQLSAVTRAQILFSRSSGWPLFSLSLQLKKSPPAADPFQASSDETDLLLYLLGSFFAALLLGTLLRFIYKKIRFRN